MTVSGEVREEKVMEYKHGQMERDMKEIGRTIRQQEEESLSMSIMIIMMENGSKTKQMGTECMYILTDQGMRVIGKMIIKMAMENNNGLMEVPILVNIKKGKSMVKDLTNGQILVTTKDSGSIIKLMAKGFIIGQMEKSMKEIG